MIRIDTLTVGMFQSNVHIISCGETGEGAIVDVGDEPERILAAVDKLHVHVKAVFATHGHIDHVAALADVVPVLGVPLYMHKGDVPVYDNVERSAMMYGVEIPKKVAVDRLLEGGEKIAVGGLTAEVIHAPGHSPGCVCLLFGKESPQRIVVGDVLFQGSIGRTDLPGGDYEAMVETLKRVFLQLPDDTIVYPGHGPETTVGREKRLNPFLGPLAREHG